MIFPSSIKVGDTIATTAVSMGCIDNTDILRLDNAIDKLETLGFRCIQTNNVRYNNKLVSSLAKDRAKEFMEVFCNDDVSVIIATSGGEFLLEILPFLDFDKISKVKPKWVQGYSDPSLLNFVLTTKLNIATVNAVNFKSFGMEPWHEVINKNIEFYKSPDILIQDSFSMFEGERVETENPYMGYVLNKEVSYKALYPSKDYEISGRVIGGCIDVLDKIVGTPFDNTVNFCSQFDEGMMWYIDNCELNIAEFYRTIWRLKQAGWFNNARGFIIGRTSVDSKMLDFTYLDCLNKCFDDLDVPVFYDVDIGHLPPQWIMVNGSLGKFSFYNGKGKIIQKMI